MAPETHHRGKGHRIRGEVLRTGFLQDPVTKRGSRGAKLSKCPGNSKGGTQNDDNLPTNEELRAMNRGRMTKLSRGD